MALKSQVFEHIENFGFEIETLQDITPYLFQKQETNRKLESPTFIIVLPFDISQTEAEKLILEYIFDLTGYSFDSINNLLQNKIINNKPFLVETTTNYGTKAFQIAFKKIRGDFRFGIEIDSLGNIEEIEGSIIFRDSLINSLGNLKKVTGDFIISEEGCSFFTNVKSLDNLSFVGGYLKVANSPLENLGELEFIGGNLNIRKTKIMDFSKLKEVGGNLLLSKYQEPILNFSKIKIHGKIRRYNDDQPI